jgi:hypothetical protein
VNSPRAAWLTLSQKVDTGKQVATAIVGAVVVATAARILLEFASRLHLVAASMLAVLIAVAALWLTYQVKHASRAADLTGVVGSLALGFLAVTVVTAWISYSLHVSGVSVYEVPAPYTMGTFMDAYMYAFLDLVPAVDIPETLHLVSPVESTDLLGGLPILGFKLFVVWLFFDAAATWIERRRRLDR